VFIGHFGVEIGLVCVDWSLCGLNRSLLCVTLSLWCVNWSVMCVNRSFLFFDLAKTSLSPRHCNARQRTATHGNLQQRTATHCNSVMRNTLQQRTSRGNIFNTLQRTATVCCIVLQRVSVTAAEKKKWQHLHVAVYYSVSLPLQTERTSNT